MRRYLALAAVALAAASPPSAVAALVSAAAVILETLPFLAVSVALQRGIGARPAFIAYAGCGCTDGPSARSLPAAALTWIAFGPIVALARLVTAIAIGCGLQRKRSQPHRHGTPSASLAGELERIVPSALCAGIAAQIAGGIDLGRHSVAAQAALGALWGFVSSPCAMGNVAIAAALHVRAPAASTAFLCVSGIVDFNVAVRRPACEGRDGDALSYAMLAAALALVAYKHGASLVHPAFVPSLVLCAVVALAFAVKNRACPARAPALAPAIVLLGMLLAQQPPLYRATETTLAQAFAGEHLSFFGKVTRNGKAVALVRYAITCCRADAAPEVVRLANVRNLTDGTWARAEGVIVDSPGGLALLAQRVTPAAPPPDPFLYR